MPLDLSLFQSTAQDMLHLPPDEFRLMED